MLACIVRLDEELEALRAVVPYVLEQGDKIVLEQGEAVLAALVRRDVERTLLSHEVLTMSDSCTCRVSPARRRTMAWNAAVRQVPELSEILLCV